MKKIGLGIFLLGICAATGAMAGPDALLQAVRAGDHAAIKNLLVRHADPNAPLADGSTVLAWAVDRQDEESVRLLLAAGAKPDIADIQGARPVTLACELGHSGIVMRLLEAGAAASAVRPDGITALALCAGTTTPAVLAKLVGKGAAVNAADAQGQTPLMRAAAAGNTGAIAFLLRQGAQVNAVTKAGFTALFFALKSGNARAPDMLLDAGARADAVLPDGGTSVAEAALIENDIPFAKRVIVRDGIDLNHRDKDGKQLIHFAAASGNGELVKLVLSRGVDPNAFTRPPTSAAVGNDAKAGGGGLARTLPLPIVIANPAMPALLYAAKAGSVDAMKALIDAGARADIKAEDGTTLALAAAGGGNLAALKYALALNPDLNAVTRDGDTIMHMAVANAKAPEAEAIVQYLADSGAKLDVPNAKGNTPGDAINRGGLETLRIFYIALLRQHGIVGIHH